MSASTRRDAAIRVRDGRTLAFCEWGVADGAAVFAFHGSPGSRVWWPGEAHTREAGVRLITVDRPGYGGSDPLPGRQIGDWAADVAELTDQLEIGRFGTIGWSGGAPYATAVAALLPDRVTGACVVSSDSITCVLPDLELDDDDRRLRDQVAELGLAETTRRYTDELADWAAGLQADPRTEFGSDDAAEGDRWIFEDPAMADGFYASFSEAVAQGAVGAASDWAALYAPWGFLLEHIEIEVQFWHGAQDWVNLAQFQRVADLVPRSTLTVWPNVGHMGVVRYWDDVLAAALGA